MIQNSLFIYCDGGSRSNPGPSAAAFIVKNSESKIIFQASKFLGVATNNQAEYQAVILALEWIVNQNKTEEVNIFLDSILITSQINGIFKIKNSELRNLLFKIRELESQIKSKIIYQTIPREKNYQADLLVNQTLDSS